MPPHLSETWASAYLQILVTVLVFALGIPAFVLQLLANEDLVQVTERRTKRKGLILSICVMGIAFTIFVWWLHPYTDEVVPAWKKWAAGLIVTLAPLSVAYFGVRFLSKFKRERVIRDLTAILMDTYTATSLRGYKRALNSGYHAVLRIASALNIGYRKKILPEKNPLQDLIYLGERGKPGHEKQLVLNAYREIASAVQYSDQYKGEELTHLIRSLVDILEDREKPGDGANYCSAAELLKSILATHVELNQSRHQQLVDLDADAVIRTFTEIGLASIKLQRDRDVMKLLAIGASCSSQIVFEMGLSALRSGRFLIATYALNKLEAEVETEATSIHGGIMRAGDVASRLLGIISHFVSAGGAARARAQTFFRNQNPSFFSRLDDCLRDAFEYHYLRTDFETADNVAALRTLTRRVAGTTRQKKKERLANYTGTDTFLS